MLIKENKSMTEAERIAAANTNNSYLQALSYIAVGTIFPFAGKKAPDTFMICDGRELDTAEYTELFSVIGYTFGGSDTTFKLPDLRGRVLVGLDVSTSHFEKIGLQGGEPEHALSEEEGPIHTHKPTNTLQGDFAYQFQTVKALNSNSTGRVKINDVTDGQYQVITANTQSDDYKNIDDISAEYATAPSGNGKAHNNLQPYTVCNYIIKVTNRFPNVIEIEYADTYYTLTEADKTDIADIVLESFTDVSEVGL